MHIRFCWLLIVIKSGSSLLGAVIVIFPSLGWGLQSFFPVLGGVAGFFTLSLGGGGKIVKFVPRAHFQ